VGQDVIQDVILRVVVNRAVFTESAGSTITTSRHCPSNCWRCHYDYNSHMIAVNIAELKARLSSYLQRVRSGEEIVIRDRNLPVAKLVPLLSSEVSAQELALAASGQLRLPTEEFNERKFWSIGSRDPVTDEVVEIAERVISREREDRDAGLLGR
jgi:prevent-host-death family protein